MTICGESQFADVKTTEEGDTVPSLVSSEVSPIVTFAVGSESRTIVKRAMPPASVVVSPLVGLTVIPAVSSSEFTTVTSSGSKPE